MNKRIILDMIRFTPGGIARAELARQMGLTRAAVTTIVSDLINTAIVREAESGPATGGRRPILLEINPKRGFVVGIDMGATHASIVITDFSAHILHEIEIPFNVDQGPDICLRTIDIHLRELLDRGNLTFKDIMSIGMGVPGPVVAEAGLVSAPPIMPGWDDYPIRGHLESIWQVPVSVNNDAELGALGEWAYGAGRGETNLAYIKVGFGVGSGLLLDGHIYRGATGCAGEIGHVTIHDGGPRCSCGNLGCLE
ncbi:MAG: ROK family protein, partial [Chloroflexota bacterium]